MSISDDFAKLACNYLQLRGYAPKPGVGAEKIDAFEDRYRVHMPEDLRAYFRAANGTTEYGDDLLTSFRSLDDVNPIRELYVAGCASYCFVIADQMISAPVFVIALGTAAPFVFRSWGARNALEPVSDSFSTFIRLFMEDPWKVHVRDYVASRSDAG